MGSRADAAVTKAAERRVGAENATLKAWVEGGWGEAWPLPLELSKPHWHGQRWRKHQRNVGAVADPNRSCACSGAV